MPGNKIGGVKAAQKNLARDPDFYRKIGSLGGRAKGKKGFALDPERARIAGAKGGRASKRTSKPKKEKTYFYSGSSEDFSRQLEGETVKEEGRKAMFKRLFRRAKNAS